jgi:apolipoprotein N-acyltransferase
MQHFFFRYQPLLLSIATGILLALSWPARGIPLLALVALVPLLWVEDNFHAEWKHSSLTRMFVHAWLAFFVFNLLTTWWIMFATIPGMLVAVLLNPVFMAIPWVVMHASRRVLPGRQGQTPLLILWLSFEYLHAIWDLSWSWLDLGNVFATTPYLIQWYEYTGTAGGTSWVLITNLLLFSLIKQILNPINANKKILLKTGLLIVVLAVPSVISATIWLRYEEKHDPVEVVIVQPSNNPYLPVESIAQAEQRLDQLTSLANTKITPHTRFVVAPEGANPRGVWIHETESHFTIQAFRDHIAQHPGLAWVLGSFAYQMYEANEPRPSSAVPFRDDDTYYDVYNSAIMIEASRPVAFYHKSKLVPGIEKMPFYTVLRPLGMLVEKFGGTQTSLGTQDQRAVFESASGYNVAPAICYESIYGDYMGEYFRHGAGLIFIVTNDGWWRNTPGHRQHNQYARLRAIESRRSIARSASTGISSFINQRGEVLQQTQWWETTAISHVLNQNYKLTFYSLQGNYLGKLSLFLTVLLLLYMITQRIIRYRK